MVDVSPPSALIGSNETTRRPRLETALYYRIGIEGRGSCSSPSQPWELRY